MTALEKLNKLAADVAAERARIEKKNTTLAQGMALMSKHGSRTIADAVYAEAITNVQGAAS